MDSIVLYEGFGVKNPPKLNTPDKTEVQSTFLRHPQPQCRVDTELAGMLCPVTFDLLHIPGYFSKGENTIAAEKDSNSYVCSRNENGLPTARPRCWFAPLENNYE
jgi:hypothetical protein